MCGASTAQALDRRPEWAQRPRCSRTQRADQKRKFASESMRPGRQWGPQGECCHCALRVIRARHCAKIVWRFDCPGARPQARVGATAPLPPNATSRPKTKVRFRFDAPPAPTRAPGRGLSLRTQGDKRQVLCEHCVALRLSGCRQDRQSGRRPDRSTRTAASWKERGPLTADPTAGPTADPTADPTARTLNCCVWEKLWVEGNLRTHVARTPSTLGGARPPSKNPKP